MKAVLFDLDGTLLPMDQNEFTSAYFKALAEHTARYGYDPQKLAGGVWKSTVAMLKNDGSDVNENVFWRSFADIFGQNVHDDKYIFDEFYSTGFERLKELCGTNDGMIKVVQGLASRADLVIASNPVFPRVAQAARMRWAGLDESMFKHITSYENSHYCKPKEGYYKEILDSLGYAAEDCVMVGNDVSDDMPARKIGMRVFLLTDCLINGDNADISEFPHGGSSELEEFLESV